MKFNAPVIVKATEQAEKRKPGRPKGSVAAMTELEALRAENARLKAKGSGSATVLAQWGYESEDGKFSVPTDKICIVKTAGNFQRCVSTLTPDQAAQLAESLAALAE